MLNDFFQQDKLQPEELRETINDLRIKVSLEEADKGLITALFDQLKSISGRDRFELFISRYSDSESISDTSRSSLLVLEEYIENNLDDPDDDECQPFELDLVITKKQQGSTLSVYCLSEFMDHLINEQKLKNVLTTFSGYSKAGSLYFEVFSTINAFYSSGIVFYPADQEPPENNPLPEKKRSQQLEMFSENASVNDLDIVLLPSDFDLEVEAEESRINQFFSEALGVMSLLYISSSSEFKKDEICSLSYKINGYKTVCCEKVDIAVLAENSKLLHKIFAWAYEGGNSVDKLGLVRNVLSIHLDAEGSVRFDNEAWEAIQSNYQVYLKDNLQSYLDVKNKIGEFIIDATAKTYNMADDILDSLKNNILVILTFILSVVVVNGLKDNGLELIFSKGYLFIVAILSVVSAIWFVMIRVESLNRFNNSSQTIKHILKLNYASVIMESEIDEIVDPVIQKNKAYLRKQIKRYGWWWFALLSIFIATFIIGYIAFSSTQEKSDFLKVIF